MSEWTPQRIRDLLKIELDWTQRKLADELGISERTLRRCLAAGKVSD
ncbi:MAG: helix-turn-helix domain-containing protein, partial [Anaerolineales bacterium]